MDNKKLIAMVLGIAAVGAVPKAVSAGQESHFIISKPNLVLRGAGRDETTLFFPKSIEQITGVTPYSDGLIKVGPTREPQAVLLTKVTKGANRGDTTMAVESTAGLRPGQMVRLRVADYLRA